MVGQSQILVSSSYAFVGSSFSTPVTWNTGGRAAVAVNAQAYAPQPGLNLQVQGPSGAWINVGSSFISDQVWVFDSTPGQYRLANLASSSIGVFATIVRIPY